MNNIYNYEINAFISIARLSNSMGNSTELDNASSTSTSTIDHQHRSHLYIQSQQTVTNITLFYK